MHIASNVGDVTHETQERISKFRTSALVLGAHEDQWKIRC